MSYFDDKELKNALDFLDEESNLALNELDKYRNIKDLGKYYEKKAFMLGFIRDVVNSYCGDIHE